MNNTFKRLWVRHRFNLAEFFLGLAAPLVALKLIKSGADIWIGPWCLLLATLFAVIEIFEKRSNSWIRLLQGVLVGFLITWML